MTRITMSDGNLIPAIGLGNYNAYGQEEINSITWALENGYRYIDSASFYKNEEELGTAISGSGLHREDIFMLSKLWPTDYERATEAFYKTLTDLKLEYLDAYLLHWPGTDEKRRLGAYEEVLKLRDKGLIRSVGVSNFDDCQIEKLYDVFGEYPVIDEFECHPAFQQRNISDYCKNKGITVIDYMPICRGRYMENETLKVIAQTHNKTVNQIILRWHIQNGQIPIPKSADKNRQKENLQVFDFELNSKEMKAINAFETGQRAGTNPYTFNGIFNK